MNGHKECRAMHWLAVLAIALAGCGSVEQSEAPPAVAAAPVALAERTPPADAIEYRLVADESELEILTFRDGAMARLGHNHLISTGTLSGTVWVPDDQSQTFVRLSLPVASLAVDLPEKRAAAGADFSDPVPESARSGTRENMLGPRVLEAASYPFVRATCGDPDGTPVASIVCLIEIRDTTVQLSLPLTVSIDGTRLVAEGEAGVSHQQLGLEAFSVAGGAIRVAEQMTLRYRIVAQRLGN